MIWTKRVCFRKHVPVKKHKFCFDGFFNCEKYLQKKPRESLVFTVHLALFQAFISRVSPPPLPFTNFSRRFLPFMGHVSILLRGGGGRGRLLLAISANIFPSSSRFLRFYLKPGIQKACVTLAKLHSEFEMSLFAFAWSNFSSKCGSFLPRFHAFWRALSLCLTSEGTGGMGRKEALLIKNGAKLC